MKSGEKRRRPWLIHHANNVRLARGGWGGRLNCKNNMLDHLFEQFGHQVLAWSKLLVSNGTKLAFELSLYIFDSWPLPHYVT